MSKRALDSLPVVEWSPTAVRVFQPGSRDPVTGKSLASVKSAIVGSEVIVAISRRSSFLRTARLPDAPKKDVAKVLFLQVGQLFPLAPGEAAVDFYLTDDRNSEGRLAVVAAVKGETLKFLQDELAANGLTARSVVPAALGSSMLAKSLGKKECAIVEEGPEGLAIDIISEGELRSSRVVPMPPPELVDGEVARSFAVAKLPCAEAIGAGGFSFPEINGSVEKSGVATLGEGSLPLTLEPPDVVLKRELGRVNSARRTAGLVWLAAVILGGLIFFLRSSDAEAIQKVNQSWQKTLGTLRKSQSEQSAALASAKKVNDALDLAFASKQELGDVIAITNNLTTEGLWLTGVTVERGKLALIRGTATNGETVTQYLKVLSGQPRFRDVTLVFANNGQIDKVNVVHFSISAHIVGNFPLTTEAKK